MRSAELHWERSGWNLHKVVGVVWQLLAEVRIFRNMRHCLQQLVTDALTALPAIRKNGVAHQDDGGPLLVKVADFVNAGVLNQSSGHKSAIRLVKNRRVSRTHFMQPPASDTLTLVRCPDVPRTGNSRCLGEESNVYRNPAWDSRSPYLAARNLGCEQY